ncbi:hypothetical protein P3S68_030465 [Capsicum galapagoense]
MGDSNNLEESLKPFYQRASEAESLAKAAYDTPLWWSPSPDTAHSGSFIAPGYPFFYVKERLARLEISVADKKDLKNEELERTVAQLQSKLKDVTAELEAEHEKGHKEVEQLTSENAKLKYRIKHLVRSLEEALSKSTSK